MRLRLISIIALGSLLAVGQGVQGAALIAQGGRVAVLPHVVLHSGTFTLADLLPLTAPAALRGQAARVPLGRAPQPGLARTLYRQQLQFLLWGHKRLLARLRLPPEISVERFHRAITRAEVIAAIQSALGSQGVESGGALNLQELQFTAPEYRTRDDPGLRVIRIACDPARHETRFRLWTFKEPRNLPFTVTVPGTLKLPTLVARQTLLPGEIVSATDFAVQWRARNQSLSVPPLSARALAGLELRAPLRAGAPVERDLFARPLLVRAGALATLIVQGQGFRIKTIVTPLEQGVFGQEIKVRNSETRKVVEAKVVGRDQLLKTR